MTAYRFRLIYTNKHQNLGRGASSISEVTGPWEWKIEQPLEIRWAIAAKALQYVTMMREKVNDPVLKRNAEKTITALKNVRSGCGTASAC